MKTRPPRLSARDTRTVAPRRSNADPTFYLTAEWRALMARLITQRGRRCEACGRVDCRIYGDHVRELKDGGAPLDEANVMLLCGSCHSTKTVAARARRMARG
jgi:5-methylcytosine-specific restriction protein A